MRQQRADITESICTVLAAQLFRQTFNSRWPGHRGLFREVQAGVVKRNQLQSQWHWPSNRCTVLVTRRYGPICGPTSSSCGRLQPSAKAFSCTSSNKKNFVFCFDLVVDHFWCSVVTLVTFSSNLSNFQKDPKNPKQIQEIPKNPKYSKCPKIQENPKNPRKSKTNLKILEIFCLPKKSYNLIFPILGGLDSTRALQSSQFQFSGGVAQA